VSTVWTTKARTPLHVTQKGCKDVALLLLEHGARPRHSGTILAKHYYIVASRWGILKIAWRVLERSIIFNSP